MLEILLSGVALLLLLPVAVLLVEVVLAVTSAGTKPRGEASGGGWPYCFQPTMNLP